MPTPDQRSQIEALVGYGMVLEDIATLFKTTRATLYRICRTEIARGHISVKNAIIRRLHDLMMSPEPKASVPATLFLAKTRLGWREVPRVHDEQGAEAAPVSAGEQRPVLIVPGILDETEWRRRAQQHGVRLGRLTSAATKAG